MTDHTESKPPHAEAKSAKKKTPLAKPNTLPDNRRCRHAGCRGRLKVQHTQRQRLDSERQSVTRYLRCQLCGYTPEPQVEIEKAAEN